jgi:glycosyltransferase involved in cell wall biosynthesis
MNPKPRILHVIDHTDSGGTQGQLLLIFQGLCDQYDFSLAVLGRTGRFSETYQNLGVTIISLPGTENRWNVGSFLPLLRLIRREKPDLIHAHLFKSMSFAALAARLTGIPCIIQDHSAIYPASLRFYFPNFFTRNLYSLFLHLVVRSNVRLLVFTPEIRDGFVRYFHAQKEKISILPNGINLERFRNGEPGGKTSLQEELGLGHDCKLIVMVGRLAPEKDWPAFLEIARNFSDPACHAFVVVGSGELEAYLRKIVKDKSLLNVYFLGQRQDVPSILKEADAFLLTSRFEAFGNVVLEAMASGCPVISTRTSGSEFMIQHESNGLLVEIGDVAGFVHNLGRVLSEAGLAEKLVCKASETILQYDYRVVGAKMSDLYMEVIQARGNERS